MKITKPEKPQKIDLDKLAEGLKAFNSLHIDRDEPKKIATFVKSESGEVMGGALGVIHWGWLYIDWLWCHESIRHQKFGSKLIEKMENYAIEQCIQNVKLETTDFQALDFYIKNEYQVYGELDNYPVGHKTYFLKKVLDVA